MNRISPLLKEPQDPLLCLCRRGPVGAKQVINLILGGAEVLVLRGLLQGSFDLIRAVIGDREGRGVEGDVAWVRVFQVLCYGSHAVCDGGIMVLVARSVLGKDSADIGTPFQETVD